MPEKNFNGSTTFVPIHDCAHTTVTTWLYPHTFVPRHDCAQIRLCPDTFVPTHVFAHTHLCPHTFVPRHDCAHTCLCPDTLVPQHELWSDMNMFLDNNNIIIVSTRLCVNMIEENTSMLNCCWRSEVKCD